MHLLRRRPSRCNDAGWTACRDIRLRLAAVAAALLLSAGALPGQAQTTALSGFVTNASNGRPLEGATVTLTDPEAEAGSAPIYGAATNADGLYLLKNVEAGVYALAISFVGYASHQDTLLLPERDAVTRSVALSPSEGALEELVVQAERDHGMARVTAGHQRIRPEEFELIPSIDISADLGNYLTTLPGILTTGDRGGQFYVRGGEPSQNLVLLDGMIVYQPFHVLGFYSAFPADIVDRADVFTGGFSGRYAGRLSSVIDVAARTGNTRRFGMMTSLSPFTSSLRLEGPIVPGHASFLVSARESFLDRGAEHIISEELPFQFGDLFAKVYGPAGRRSRLSLTALRTHDRGTVGRDGEIRWRNEAYGARWLVVPQIYPFVLTVHLSHSLHSTELGPQEEPLRTSEIRHIRAGMEAVFSGDAVTWNSGWDVLFADAVNSLGGLYQVTNEEIKGLSTWGFYIEPDVNLRYGLSLHPSVRIHWYRVRIDPYVEPRLRATWSRGVQQVSAAMGIYHQEIVGLSDRRDLANVFTAWSGIPTPDADDPRAGLIGQAFHGTLGYRSSVRPWLEVSVEGFYKHLRNLFVSEWTSFPHLTTRLHPASGRSLGLEARVELRRGRWYGFLNYGLSSTRYRTEYDAIRHWFGTESLAFRPPHDRRHHVNALLNATVAGIDLTARWTLGTGLPYTRPRAFDGFALLDEADSIFDLQRMRRVIFEEPYGAQLPAYHRLDISVERPFTIPGGTLTLQASMINVYDRRNVFYVDAFTTDRIDQLPRIPSLGVRVEFE